MSHDPEQILAVLDECCERYAFPVLDNGYVYLAASRLTAYWSPNDWALVIEIFGYSPRSGFPDVHVCTYASRLHNRDTGDDYTSDEAYRSYLRNNPNNDSRFFFPIEGDYQDPHNDEFVSETAHELFLRGHRVALPSVSDYAAQKIRLIDNPRARVFELCRYLAAIQCENCLAIESERRCSVLPEMEQILQLEEWRHPDLTNNEFPSTSVTFQHLSRVFAKGDPSQYAPNELPNTHWINWPDAGTL